jgi:phosphoglycolate phosphatase
MKKNDCGFKGVVFDLDGTLADSLPDIAKAINTILTGLGLPAEEPETFRNRVGWGLRRAVELSLPDEMRDDSTLDSLLPELISVYRANPSDHAVLYPGIKETVSKLSRMGIPMGVWTNKEEKIAVSLLNRLLPEKPFRLIVGERPERPKKPDPHASKLFLNSWGLERDSICYAGDTEVDMETARNAGFYPVGVTWGYREVEELKNSGAKKIIPDPASIIKLVNI